MTLAMAGTALLQLCYERQLFPNGNNDDKQTWDALGTPLEL